jgi:hypothetical protein
LPQGDCQIVATGGSDLGLPIEAVWLWKIFQQFLKEICGVFR